MRRGNGKWRSIINKYLLYFVVVVLSLLNIYSYKLFWGDLRSKLGRPKFFLLFAASVPYVALLVTMYTEEIINGIQFLFLFIVVPYILLGIYLRREIQKDILSATRFFRGLIQKEKESG